MPFLALAACGVSSVFSSSFLSSGDEEEDEDEDEELDSVTPSVGTGVGTPVERVLPSSCAFNSLCFLRFSALALPASDFFRRFVDCFLRSTSCLS